MLKYAKIVNEKTKQCEVGTGTNMAFYKSMGMHEMDVEQTHKGEWYLSGYAPNSFKKTYVEKRLDEYPPISDQLDMLYWDKMNGTQNWINKITEIKAKYPKT